MSQKPIKIMGFVALAIELSMSKASAQGLRITDYAMRQAFINLPIVLTDNFQTFVLDNNQERVRALCEKIAATYKSYRWNPDSDGCGNNGIKWQGQLKSIGGNPLIFAEFGQGPNTTLILGGVHPDELTPIPLAFKFANHLQSHANLIPAGSRVIIAPLINPDGFFRKGATRTNLRGVDLNRNFFTQDWYATAKTWWTTRRQKNERHFPGHIPNSEIETLYQIWLIDNFKPDKIISIHAPLGFYDYDGPGDQKPRALTPSEEKAKALVQNMSESSRNYKIVDYSFYPGSLGNYAGNERGIPTVTLELETSDPGKSEQYWKQFSPGLEHAINYPFVNKLAPTTKGTSLFLEAYGKMTAKHGEILDKSPKF